MKPFSTTIPQRVRRNPGAAGFTLVEILLALTLTLVLMSGVYVAFQMYNRLSSTGRDEVEQSQIVRAVQRKMAADIRSVVFPPLEEDEQQMSSGGSAAGTSSTTGGSSPTQSGTSGSSQQASGSTTSTAGGTAQSSTGSSATGSGTATEAIAATAEGIVGDSTSLVLHISRPPRGGLYDSAQYGLDVNRRLSDLVSVTYLLASPDGGTLHAAVAGKTGQSGLARLVGDRLTMNTLDESGAVDRLAEAAEILAPEVTALSFRYSDGTADPANWPDSWDSVAQGSLPRAIQVTVTVRPSSARTDDENVVEKTYSFLIAVPLSDPTPLDLLQQSEP